MAIISKNPPGDADTKKHQPFVDPTIAHSGQSLEHTLESLILSNDYEGRVPGQLRYSCELGQTTVAPQD